MICTFFWWGGGCLGLRGTRGAGWDVSGWHVRGGYGIKDGGAGQHLKFNE